MSLSKFNEPLVRISAIMFADNELYLNPRRYFDVGGILHSIVVTKLGVMIIRIWRAEELGPRKQAKQHLPKMFRVQSGNFGRYFKAPDPKVAKAAAAPGNQQLYDIIVYDEHIRDLDKLNVNDYVFLVNVHYYVAKDGGQSLALHGGRIYHRGIYKIPRDLNNVKFLNFKKKIENAMANVVDYEDFKEFPQLQEPEEEEEEQEEPVVVVDDRISLPYLPIQVGTEPVEEAEPVEEDEPMVVPKVLRRLVDEPIQMEQEPVEPVEPIVVLKKPIRLADEPMQLEQEPAHVEQEPAHVEQEPQEPVEPIVVSKKPIKLANEPIQVVEEPAPRAPTAKRAIKMTSINVKEIIESSSSSSHQPAKKKARFDNTASTLDADEVLAALDNDQSTFVAMDEAQVKKLVAQLEKKIKVNREQRVKYPDDPQKFMESEIELNTCIQEMHILATQPDLYGVFCEVNGVEIMLQLLGHENSDIVCAALALLRELTDDTAMDEEEEGCAELIEALLKGSIISTILACIEKLDETVKDEADGVNNALGIIDNMINFRDDISDDCAENGFIIWLLKRCAQRGTFDGNKMNASELLSMILQSSDTAKEKMNDKVDGMDVLLRAVAYYKRNDPASNDEHEYMENLFNSLCAALMILANRKTFLLGEGLQLMNLILREKRHSRQGALKVLNHATSGEDGIENCNKFVEILGLRTLFPLFMRTPSKSMRKDTSPAEHEEHVCAILSSLLAYCTEAHRLRIVQKFIEHEHEKVDRAVELFLKYKEQVQRFELKKKKQSQEPSTSAAQDDDDQLEKLNNGLYTLQRLALILADVAVSSETARRREEKLFQMKMSQNRLDLMLNPILQEYSDNLGEEAAREQERVLQMINKLEEMYQD